jgi:N-glycosylase/DNA lyase
MPGGAKADDNLCWLSKKHKPSTLIGVPEVHIVEGHLEFPEPFSLRLTLYMGQAFRWRRLDGSVDKLDDGGRYSDDEWHSGVLGEFLIHLRQVGSAVEYRATKLGEPADDEAVGTLLQSYFRLEDDVSRIYGDLGDRDANMARLIEIYGGMRLLRQDPWECLVSYICSKSNRILNIRHCVSEISRLSEVDVALDNERRFAFPSSRRLQEVGVPNLLGVDLAGRFRGGFPTAIVAAAKRVRDGELNFPALRLQSHSSVLSTLMQGPRNGRTVPNGIGLKIADCVAMMSLDKLEAFPVDTHIKKAVARNYSSAPRSNAAIGTWAQQHFGQYAGYAGQLMFCEQPK